MKICIYVDIDGTISDAQWRVDKHILKKPKNWKAFYAAISLDKPHEDIVWLVKTLHTCNVDIIICTGREEKYREATEEWLKRHDIPYTKLYMRKRGDHRKDYIVKAELYDQMVSEGYKPILCLEDRDQVVSALRNKGIRVLQVCKDN